MILKEFFLPYHIQFEVGDIEDDGANLYIHCSGGINEECDHEDRLGPSGWVGKNKLDKLDVWAGDLVRVVVNDPEEKDFSLELARHFTIEEKMEEVNRIMEGVDLDLIREKFGTAEDI